MACWRKQQSLNITNELQWLGESSKCKKCMKTKDRTMRVITTFTTKRTFTLKSDGIKSLKVWGKWVYWVRVLQKNPRLHFLVKQCHPRIQANNVPSSLLHHSKTQINRQLLTWCQLSPNQTNMIKCIKYDQIYTISTHIPLNWVNT